MTKAALIWGGRFYFNNFLTGRMSADIVNFRFSDSIMLSKHLYKLNVRLAFLRRGMNANF